MIRAEKIELPAEEQEGNDGEIYDINLVNTLLGHHREDYPGMLDEEKLTFIKNLNDIANNPDERKEIKIAAKLFLKEQEIK